MNGLTNRWMDGRMVRQVRILIVKLYLPTVILLKFTYINTYIISVLLKSRVFNRFTSIVYNFN